MIQLFGLMSIFWTQKEGCYKDGAKSKTYSVTIKSDIHKSQIAFQESEYFKEKSKERYKIEAKNSELKHRHGYDKASSSGLIGMEIQGVLAIFTVNIKRILKILRQKYPSYYINNQIKIVNETKNFSFINYFFTLQITALEKH